jgi:hypothetical protein
MIFARPRNRDGSERRSNWERALPQHASYNRPSMGSRRFRKSSPRLRIRPRPLRHSPFEAPSRLAHVTESPRQPPWLQAPATWASAEPANVTTANAGPCVDPWRRQNARTDRR